MAIQIINMALGVLGVIGLVIGSMALIEIKALKQSTHKIQWVPAEQPLSGLADKGASSVDNIYDDDDHDLFGDDIDLFMDRKKGSKIN